MREKLKEQDWLTTVVEQEADTSTCACHRRDDRFRQALRRRRILAALSDPSIRIVSLTVTEGGYYISPATQHFDPAHPDIVYDARARGRAEDGLRPDRRRAQAPPRRGRRAFHGDVLRQSFPATATSPRTPSPVSRSLPIPNSRAGFAPTSPFPIRWSTASRRRRPTGNARFCATSAASRTIGRSSARSSGSGWWRTSSRPGGRRWRRSASRSPRDVAPYELMKIRILNGGHAAIAYPAGLLDIHFVHEAMADEQIRAFLEKLTKSEIQPVVPPPPEHQSRRLSRVDRRAASPTRRSATRFSASASTARTASRNSSCPPSPIAESGRDPSRAWRSCRRCGAAIAMAKPRAASRSRRTTRAGSACKRRRSRRATIRRPSSQLHHIFGDLARDPGYVRAFSDALSALWAQGVRSTLADYLSDKA